MSQILIDGVDGNGGAKNAGVIGYDIAAKTGTSQKFDILDENGNSYLRIGSTVAYAQSDDGGISLIIVVDEPTSQVKYGSVVAAPYVSMLYERILPYLDFKSENPETNTAVDNYVGLSVDEVKSKLEKERIAYEIIGNGNRVIKQTPDSGDILTYPLSKILLYTEEMDDEKAFVPNVVGLSLSDAIRKILDAGLNIRISGNGATNPSACDKVISQSITSGTEVKRGDVITIRAIKEDYED